VRDVGFALGRLAERLSTRSVRLARMILIQAIRNAIPDIAVAALRELVLTQAAARAKAGVASKESNLVFCTSPGHAHRRNRAVPAAREQRKDRRRPKLSVRLPVRLPMLRSIEETGL